jgi:signal transduction histidine kinase
MTGEPADTLEHERLAQLERTLALARAALALLVLALGVWQFPGSTAPPVTAEMIIAYNVYALVAAGLVGVSPPRPALGVLLHVCDMLWAVSMTAGIDAIASTSSVFFLFVLVSAAYRWGLWQTVSTALVTAVLQSVEAATTLFGLEPRPTAVQRAELLTWSTYLVGLACFLGYLADEQNRSRARAAAAARILAAVDSGGGFRTSLHRVLDALRTTLDAGEAAVFFEERGTGRIYQWSLRRTDTSVRLDERPAAERETWLFPLAGTARAWLLRRTRRGVAGVSDLVSRRRRIRRPVPVSAGLTFERRALVGMLHAGEEWTGRLIVSDPRRRTDTRTIDWLATLVTHLEPALYSLYLLRRLRSRVSAVERTRLARELHDGLVQTLVGIEMQIEVIRRRAAAGQRVDPDELLRIEQHLHAEVLTARDLMQRVRPVEFNPRDLPGRLADLAERFRRDAGIDVRFVCTFDEAELSPRLAAELLRISQEALVNVRKHSGASHVLIRFSASPSHWTLVIDDNGRGFEFTGRHTLDELDRTRRGPAVIKERVRGIRGGLILDSLPGRGSSLEITVPRT